MFEKCLLKHFNDMWLTECKLLHTPDGIATTFRLCGMPLVTNQPEGANALNLVGLYNTMVEYLNIPT